MTSNFLGVQLADGVEVSEACWGRLDVLVCNGAVSRSRTVEGFEMQFGVNRLIVMAAEDSKNGLGERYLNGCRGRPGVWE